MTCGLSANVGFVRRMAVCSVANSWLARGNSWSRKYNMNTARNAEATTAGRISARDEIPPALNAVISFSDARRLNAYNTATSTDIGTVIASVNGIDSRKNSVIVCQDSPFPTMSPKRRAMYWRSRRDVSAESANTNGPTCSLSTYREMIFTREIEAAPNPRTASATQGCTPVYGL